MDLMGLMLRDWGGGWGVLAQLGSLTLVSAGVWRAWWLRLCGLDGWAVEFLCLTNYPILLSILKNSQFSYYLINFKTISANPFPNSTLKSLHPFHRGAIPIHNPINQYRLFNAYQLRYPFSQPLHWLATYEQQVSLNLINFKNPYPPFPLISPKMFALISIKGHPSTQPDQFPTSINCIQLLLRTIMKINCWKIKKFSDIGL